MDPKEAKNLAREVVEPLKANPLLLVVLVMFSTLVGYSFWQMDSNAEAIRDYVLGQQEEQWKLITRLVDELDKCEETIRGRK